MSSGARKKYTNFYQNNNDKDEEELYKYYTNSSSTTTQQNLQSKYELDRAQRQMGHYFDSSKQAVNTSPTLIPPSKTQLQYWKQKKEDKKKKKDAWLYE